VASQPTQENAPERGVDNYLFPVETGDQIVIFKEDATNALDLLQGFARSVAPGFAIATSVSDGGEGADAVLDEDLNIAFISHRSGSAQSLAMANALRARPEVAEVIPDFCVFALDVTPTPTALAQDTQTSTWGVKAVGAEASRYTGKGIRIAILDTGLDLKHPDFSGRIGKTKSFIDKESVQDGNGHGTHCAGSAAGARAAGSRPRYGVAPDATVMAGKVLSNTGSGSVSSVVSGIKWAADNGADVISMSLGARTSVGTKPLPAFERVAAYALKKGALVVAAAGNDSNRAYNYIAPVNMPANCPSIMAVAAIDQAGDIGNFSCGGINGDGGEVNLSAPGVRVYSSWPMPAGYRYASGTSMACPHVAGVAALWAESNKKLRGKALWKKLEATARGTALPPRDEGKGIVQAP
jgi:subtilisin family serine protease